MASEKHIFALFWSNPAVPLKTLTTATLLIDNHHLCNRIQTVLRLTVGDTFTLFDHEHHIQATLKEITKKNCTVHLGKVAKNQNYLPTITYALPLLKREALEMALDALTQLGATTIQLITTKKIQRAWSPKDFERSERIIIAAAEQSKNYAFPLLQPPITLEGFVRSLHTTKSCMLFFDAQGQPASDSLQEIKNNQCDHIVMTSGPEGDLTEQEKAFLKEHGFLFTALTPTILRAEQAAALGLGIVRSLL